MIKKLLVFIVLLAISGSSFASHLVGGSLGYEYLGQFGGNFRYKIILTVYNNCDAFSNIPLPVQTQPVAIYDHDVSANTPMLGGNKALVTNLNLNLVDSERVDPPIASGCPVGQAVCIYKGIYEATVDLPLSFTGYHMYFTNFARNASITNLLNPGGTAMSFHAYIPPTLVNNSSPVFSDDPVPFLCINDTVSILNTAIDPDGDQLVFSFVTPMADAGGPFPPTPLNWPIVNVNYAGGYNTAQPFGATGHSFINGATGLTEYMSPTLGNFVVAVEIKEIRNGNVIGITRRDLQLLVINCPPNPAPNLSAVGGSGITNYTIQECDTLTFPITFVDANGDSLELTTTGQIFDTSFVNPAATLDSLVIGDSTVTANFFWQTACGTAQALPYLFTVSVTDNGCPPKTTNVVYQVTVEPATPPDSIIGPIIVCQNDFANYTTPQIPGYTFNWTVTNGTIISGQGTNNINVNWPNVGAGLVTVNAISDCGCPSISIDTAITIIASPPADAGADTNLCLGDTIQIGGSPTGPIGTTFTWSPSTNMNDSTLTNPSVSPTTTTTYVVAVDNGVCIGYDTVTVTVGSATIDAGLDTSLCLGDSIQLNAAGGVSYLWTPSTGLSNDTIPNPIATPSLTTVYTVTVTDSLGCIGSDSITIQVNTLSLITITNDTTICDGDCVQLNASGGNSYSWTPSTGLSNDTIANPIACPLVTTTYIVSINDTNSCSGIDSVEITVNPSPTVVTNNDTSVCDGICVQLNASGASSYVWSPSTGLSNDTIANPIACPLVTTTYIVTGTDTNGCFSNDTVTITINQLPSVDAGPDQGICVVGSVVIGGAPTGPLGSSYLWSPSPTLNDDTLANPLASPLATTTYTVTVTDSNGCVDFDVVTVAINPQPIVDAGNDTTICEGQSIVIGGSPTGPLNAGYLWTPNTSLNDDTLQNPNASPLVSTQYIVTITDSNNCTNSDTVDINVNPSPTITSSNDTSLCLGACYQMNASGGLSYVWTPSGGLSNDTIFNPVACPTGTTTYIVTGTDINGCFDTSSTTITVNPLPIITTSPDTSVCLGTCAPLFATGGTSYSWSPGATLSDSTVFNPTACPLVTTTYAVTVTNGNNCTDTASVTIIVDSLPIVDAGLDTSICFGDSIQLSATGAITYAWTPNTNINDSSLSNPIVFPPTTTTYYVVGTNANGCVNTDSVIVSVNPSPTITSSNDTSLCLGACYQMNASGGLSYVWTPSGGLSNDTIFNPVACPTGTTTYIVTGTDINGCFDTSSTTITVNPLPIITTSPDTSVCLGTCAPLFATGGTSYSWSPGATLSDSTVFNPTACPLVTTTYAVTVTNGNNCTDTASVTIIVDSLPIVDAGLDTSICFGDSIQLSATGAITYAWTPNTNINDSSLSNPIVFPPTTTTYYVVGTNANGCVNTDSVIVSVNSLPLITISNDTSVCLGDCAQLLAGGGTNYLWSPGGTLSDSTIFNPIACPTGATTYIVTVTNGNNCTDTASVVVTVNPLPVINAGPDVWLCSGDSTQLNATGGLTYLWTPSLGLNDSTISNPIAFPLDTTDYILIGFDINGCSSNDTVRVIVDDEVPIDPGVDTTICFGDSITLGGAPTSPNGTSYSWFPNATLDNDTLANPTAFPTVTTTYYVVATNDTCTAIDSVTIFVNPPPNPNAGPDLDICFGDSVQFNASGGINYLWNNGSFLSDSTIFNPNSFPNDTLEFIVLVTDSNGCRAFDSLTVNVNPLPNISAGSAASVCSGDSVQLNASGGLNYVWTPALGLSNDTIANPLASPSFTTTYYLTGTDSNGCSNFDSVLVTINQLNVPDLNDTIICIGDAMQLTVNAPVGATYLWTPSTDLSNDTIFNPITVTQVTITYLVTITDTNGCVDTTSITITAESKPTSAFTADLNPLCEGVLAEFTNLSTGAISYLWDFGDGETSTEISPNYIFPYGSNSTVLLTAYSGGICPDTSSLVINPDNFDDYFNIDPPKVFTPNRDGMNDLFKLDLPNEVSNCTNITIFNRWGIKLFDSQGLNIGWDGRTTAGVKVPVGTYFYIIDINGLTKKGSLTVLE
ncbi:MAG: gliding motility-associated C-terminal domain-containing protein [Vicingaceae bacterium]|nr:gliding motility-associated C-terminal domain-containing protein [Vicingaceae bacterium]